MRRIPGLLAAIALLVGAMPAAAAVPIPSLQAVQGLNHDAAVVEAYYRQHPGQRSHYASLWFGHTPYRLVVMVTDDPLARPYPWEKDIANPDLLRFRSVEFSYGYLRGIQKTILQAAENHQPWAKRICGFGVDVIANVVTIETYTGHAPKGFWAHYAGLFPRRAVAFEPGCPNEGVGEA